LSLVAGTDLMAALRQSIDKAKEETPKANAWQAAPAVGTKPAAAAKGKRAVKGGLDQREMLLPIAGGAPATEAGGLAKGSGRGTNGAKSRRTEKNRVALAA
jgi:hypothetical protein